MRISLREIGVRARGCQAMSDAMSFAAQRGQPTPVCVRAGGYSYPDPRHPATRPFHSTGGLTTVHPNWANAELDRLLRLILRFDHPAIPPGGSTNPQGGAQEKDRARADWVAAVSRSL